MAERPAHPLPFVSHGREPEHRSPLSRDDHEVDPRGQEIRPQPEALPADPLHAISLDGRAELLGHDQPESGRRARVSARPRHEEDKVAARRTPGLEAVSARLDALEVRVSPDLSVPRKRAWP